MNSFRIFRFILLPTPRVSQKKTKEKLEGEYESMVREFTSISSAGWVATRDMYHLEASTTSVERYRESDLSQRRSRIIICSVDHLGWDLMIMLTPTPPRNSQPRRRTLHLSEPQTRMRWLLLQTTLPSEPQNNGVEDISGLRSHNFLIENFWNWNATPGFIRWCCRNIL
jgi:hypothetical protein